MEQHPVRSAVRDTEPPVFQDIERPMTMRNRLRIPVTGSAFGKRALNRSHAVTSCPIAANVRKPRSIR